MNINECMSFVIQILNPLRVERKREKVEQKISHSWKLVKCQSANIPIMETDEAKYEQKLQQL